MNILVADDEFYARKALIRIIQDWGSSLSIYEAQNGKEAQTILQSEPIDLVFTDIRMPQIDGLQLSALISVHYPQVTNVIVSGFDDFKYAQEAIVYQVSKYLLKPVDKNEVYHILGQVQAKETFQALQRFTQKLRFLLHEDLSSVHFNQLELPQVHSYATIVLQTMGNTDFSLLKDIVSEVFLRHDFVYFHLEDFRIANMSIVIMLAPDHLTAEKLWIKGSLVRQMVKNYSEKAGNSMTAGISRIHLQIESLAESYREAKSLVLYRLIRSESIFESETITSQYRSQPTDDLFHPLYHKILNNHLQEAAAIIEGVFKRIVELKLSVHTLKDTSYKLITIMNSVIESFPESEDRMAYLEPIDLFQFHRMEQLIGFLHNILYEIGRKVVDATPKTDMIDELKAHIERHYQNHIKLEEIAKSLYYADPSYLSKQFKKRFGISFTQYLISVRLKKAKQMVKEYGESLTISEIARAVGFNDYSYFIQMYKKHYGETPGKDKKGHQE